MADNRELLRIEEVARRLSLGRTKTYEMVNKGEFPAIRIGRSIRIPAASVAKWVARQTTAAHDNDTWFEDTDEEGGVRRITRLR